MEKDYEDIMESKNFFSYIDTYFRIVHVNLSLSDRSAKEAILQYIDLSETSSTAKSYFIQQIIANEFNSTEKAFNIIKHEYHHYWQSLFYPFLYLMNVIEFMTIQQAASQIRQNMAPDIPFDDIHLSNEAYTNLTYLTIEFDFLWNNNILIPIDCNDKSNYSELRETFTLNDLIEDPTSIFEYKLANKETNGTNYSEWLRDPSNNSYKKLFRFLEQIVGSDNAFDIIPMLVQLAFYTTEPASGFCNCFNYWYAKKQLGTQNFCPTFEDYLELKLLMEFHYSNNEFEFEHPLSIAEMKTIFLNESMINKLVNFNFNIGSDYDLYYPIADHFKKFNEEKKSNKQLESYLFTADNVNYLLKKFEPFAVHTFLLDLNGRNSMLTFGKDFQEKLVYDEMMNFDSFVKESYKILTTTIALLTDFQNVLPHNCHHIDCPYYFLNKCRKWNAIPRKWQDCGFPYWFGWFFKYRIDLVSQKYCLLTTDEENQYGEKYKERSHRLPEFDYLSLEDEYVMVVSKKHILNDKNGTLFKDFIEFLTRKTGISKENFLEKIMFDFYDYNNDERELFEISEVTQWMIRIKQTSPELFLFINFNKNMEARKSLFLPMFIEHTKKLMGDKYQIVFDEKSYDNFWKEEFNSFIDVAKAEKYDIEKIFSLLNRLIFSNDRNQHNRNQI